MEPLDHGLLAVAFVAITAFFIYALATRNYRVALLVLFGSLPLKSVYLVLGGYFMELWKLFSLLCLPLTLPLFRRPSKPLLLLATYFLFSVTVLILATVGLLYTPADSDLQRILRLVGQIFQLLAFLNLAPMIVLLSRGQPDALNASCGVYVSICTLLAFLGLFQYWYWTTTGVNLFPVPRLTGETEDAFLNYIGDMNIGGVLRVNSLSMEPKNLALYLVVALIFQAERLQAGLARISVLTLASTAAMIACLILTLSTLGYVALLLYMGFAVFNRRTLAAVAILLAVATLYVSFADNGRLAFELFAARSYGRVYEGGLEDFDRGALDFLLANPLAVIAGVGFGNLHLVAGQYLPAFAHWAASTNWHAKMGILYVITGSGIVGLGLLYGAIAVTINNLRFHRAHYLSAFSLRLLLFFALLFLVKNTEWLYIALGMALAATPATQGVHGDER